MGDRNATPMLDAKEFRQCLEPAEGSLREVETQRIIAYNLGDLDDPPSMLDPSHEIARWLNGLLNFLMNGH